MAIDIGAELPKGAIQNTSEKPQNSGGGFKAFREKVAGAFRRNIASLGGPAETSENPAAPTVIAGREVPTFNTAKIDTTPFPEKPAGIAQPEPIIDATNGVRPVIHQTVDGPVIDATPSPLPEIRSARESFAAKPKEKESAVRQEIDQITDLTPEFRRKEINEIVAEFVKSETSQDPKSVLKGIDDPTDQLYALAELARQMAFKSASHDGKGGNISPDSLRPQAEGLYSGYKDQVYSSGKKST